MPAKLNWEGIIFKRGDAAYRSERNKNWLTIKVVQKGKFPVVGFVQDQSGVAALYLGKRKAKTLSTWARLARDGLALSPARSGSNSTRSSARSRN
jgi:ATP-dependent DNA ligase